MELTSYSQAITYLESFIPDPSRKFPGEAGLKRMSYFMNLLNNPQLAYSTIHVAGTSGKGSTSTMIAKILSTKYQVGLHTSPHISDIRERIAINGQMISKEDFVLILNDLISSIEKTGNQKWGSPSYFEILTAMAFVYFKSERVDVAVIEVGMGGRWDGTNIIHPTVAVITSIGLDHTQILGDTIEKIASEKAGIIKPHIPVITGVDQPSVIQIIQDVCAKNDSNQIRLFKDFNYAAISVTESGSDFDYRGLHTYDKIHLSLLGEFQIRNAAVAIRAVEEWEKINDITSLSHTAGTEISEGKIKSVLSAIHVPGRMEIVSKKPLVVLDGAHNGDKATALAHALGQIYPKKRIISIVAIKGDKDAAAILCSLSQVSTQFIFPVFRTMTDVGVGDFYHPKDLEKIIRSTNPRMTVMIESDVHKAFRTAQRIAGKDDVILITGSLYLVGEMMKEFKNSINLDNKRC